MKKNTHFDIGESDTLQIADLVVLKGGFERPMRTRWSLKLGKSRHYRSEMIVRTLGSMRLERLSVCRHSCPDYCYRFCVLQVLQKRSSSSRPNASIPVLIFSSHSAPPILRCWAKTDKICFASAPATNLTAASKAFSSSVGTAKKPC